jgi:hypothetical protein
MPDISVNTEITIQSGNCQVPRVILSESRRQPSIAKDRHPERRIDAIAARRIW